MGDTVPVLVIRKGEQKTLRVKIGKLKEQDSETSQAAGDKTPNLGMAVREITPELAETYNLSEKSGVMVNQVAPGSPAAEAGLKPKDIIIEVDQKQITGLDAFMKKIRTYRKGDTILLLVSREGATRYVTMEIG